MRACEFSSSLLYSRAEPFINAGEPSMKSILHLAVIAALSLVTLACSASQQHQIERNAKRDIKEEAAKTLFEVEKLPTSVDAFLDFRNGCAGSPEGAAATFTLAMVIYAENPELGMQCLTIAIHPDQLEDDSEEGVYMDKRPTRRDMENMKSRVGDKPETARSYIRETTTDTDYRLPDDDLTIVVRDGQDYGDDVRVFVYSTGADSPRPIRLRESSNGYWKAVEWSSLTVGVKKRKDVKPDDL